MKLYQIHSLRIQAIAKMVSSMRLGGVRVGFQFITLIKARMLSSFGTGTTVPGNDVTVALSVITPAEVDQHKEQPKPDFLSVAPTESIRYVNFA